MENNNGMIEKVDAEIKIYEEKKAALEKMLEGLQNLMKEKVAELNMFVGAIGSMNDLKKKLLEGEEEKPKQITRKKIIKKHDRS